MDYTLALLLSLLQLLSAVTAAPVPVEVVKMKSKVKWMAEQLLVRLNRDFQVTFLLHAGNLKCLQKLGVFLTGSWSLSWSRAAGSTGLSSQPSGWWSGWTLIHSDGLGGLQQPDLRRPRRGLAGQVRHLFTDWIPGSVEAGALHWAAAKAFSAGPAARATEQEGVHPHCEHRGSHEGEGVPQSAAEKSGSSWDLLKKWTVQPILVSCRPDFRTGFVKSHFCNVLWRKCILEHALIYTDMYLFIYCIQEYVFWKLVTKNLIRMFAGKEMLMQTVHALR